MDSKFVFVVTEEITETTNDNDSKCNLRIIQSFPNVEKKYEGFKISVTESMNVRLKNRPTISKVVEKETLFDDNDILIAKEFEESAKVLDSNFERFNSCLSTTPTDDYDDSSEKAQMSFLEMLNEKNKELESTNSTEESLSDDDNETDDFPQIEGIIDDELKFNRIISRFNRRTRENLLKIAPNDVGKLKTLKNFSYTRRKNSSLALQKKFVNTIENLVIGTMGINQMFQLFEYKRGEGVAILQKLVDKEFDLKKKRDLLWNEISHLWDDQQKHLEPKLENFNVRSYFNQIENLLNQINGTNNLFCNIMLNSNSPISKYYQELKESFDEKQSQIIYPDDPHYAQFNIVCKSHKWDFTKDIFNYFKFTEDPNFDDDFDEIELQKELISFMGIIESFKAIYPIQDLLNSQIFSKYSSYSELKKTNEKLKELKISLQDQNNSLKSNFRRTATIQHSLERITGLVRDINVELSNRNEGKINHEILLKYARGVQVSAMFLSTRENLISQFPQCEEFATYEGIVFSDKGEIRGVTVDAQLDILISNHMDTTKLENVSKIQKTFLLTFDYYLSARELLEKLIIRYCISPTNSIPTSMENHQFPEFDDLKISVQIPQRSRVIAIIRQWISLHFKRDFHTKPENLQRLIDFLTNTVALTGNLFDAKSIYSDLRKLGNTIRLASSINNGESDANNNLNTKNSLNSFKMEEVSLLIVNPADFANQLTIFEFEKFFKHLEPKEFLHQVWNKKELRETEARNVVQFVKHFNKVSSFIVKSILAENSVETRAQIIRRVIAIGLHLLKLNNYNGVIEIMAGLKNSSIDRLLLSWELVGPQLFEVKQRLATLNLDKMKLLRYQWERTSAPAIPYIGLFLTDLTFLEDGNPSFIGDEKKLTNFFKFQKISETIEVILKHQQIAYHIPINPQFFQLFESFPEVKFDNNEEREWLKRSKEIESARDVSAVKRFKVNFPEEDIKDLYLNLNLLRNHPLVSSSSDQPVNVNSSPLTTHNTNPNSNSSSLSSVSNPVSVVTSTPSPNQNVDQPNNGGEVQLLPDHSGYLIGGKEYSLIQLEDIAGKWRFGVPTKERRYHMKLFKNTFLGSEAVTWLAENVMISRKEALLLGQLLLEKNYIQHVSQTKNLKDSSSIYQFLEKIQYHPRPLSRRERRPNT